MLQLLILMLDVIEMDPDNDVSVLMREFAFLMRRIPVWERKSEWKRVRLALKHRFHDKITAAELIERVTVHMDDLEDKIKG